MAKSVFGVQRDSTIAQEFTALLKFPSGCGEPSVTSLPPRWPQRVRDAFSVALRNYTLSALTPCPLHCSVGTQGPLTTASDLAEDMEAWSGSQWAFQAVLISMKNNSNGESVSGKGTQTETRTSRHVQHLKRIPESREPFMHLLCT